MRAFLIRAGILGTVALAVFLSGIAESAQPDKREWQQRYTELIVEVQTLEQRVVLGEAAYSRNKTRHRLSGERKIEIIADLNEAKAQLVDAKQRLEAFPDEARRAGVPPGWLREVDERRGRD